LLQAMELNWPLETAAFGLVPWLRGRLPRGDGHPVLVVPGFTADDRSTRPLRAVLRDQGFASHGWSLGSNMGSTSGVVAGLRARLLQLHARHGRRVTLVGWSLGGVYARLLAAEHPGKIRQVVTLASPYRMVEVDRSASYPIWRRVEHLHDGRLAGWGVPEADRPPLQVPATSIYSRTDGVVRWEKCIDETESGCVYPRAENIEVRATHVGLGTNPAVIVAILDRLGQPEDRWRPFRPHPLLVGWFPRPATRPPPAESAWAGEV